MAISHLKFKLQQIISFYLQRILLNISSNLF